MFSLYRWNKFLHAHWCNVAKQIKTFIEMVFHYLLILSCFLMKYQMYIWSKQENNFQMKNERSQKQNLSSLETKLFTYFNSNSFILRANAIEKKTKIEKLKYMILLECKHFAIGIMTSKSSWKIIKRQNKRYFFICPMQMQNQLQILLFRFINSYAIIKITLKKVRWEIERERKREISSIYL